MTNKPDLPAGPTESVRPKLRRLGKTGAVIGLISVLACELPIIIAVLGFSSLAPLLVLPPLVETIGLALGGLGVLLLLSLFIQRRLARTET